MVIGTGVTFTSRCCRSYLSEDDYPGWAAVNAESASGANVVINNEDHIV